MEAVDGGRQLSDTICFDVCRSHGYRHRCRQGVGSRISAIRPATVELLRPLFTERPTVRRELYGRQARKLFANGHRLEASGDTCRAHSTITTAITTTTLARASSTTEEAPVARGHRWFEMRERVATRGFTVWPPSCTTIINHSATVVALRSVAAMATPCLLAVSRL